LPIASTMPTPNLPPMGYEMGNLHLEEDEILS